MALTPFLSKKNKLIIPVVGIAWSGIQYAILKDYGIGTTVALTDSTISNLFLLAGCTLIFNSLRYYRPERTQFLYLVIWCLTISGLWYLLVKFTLGKVMGQDPGYMQFLNQSMILRFYIAFLCTGCVALISVIYFNLLEKHETESRKEVAEKLSREAELYNLRQQLQPHFLFNSLNSISALAGSDPTLARKMIQQLSDFLRGTIRKEDAQWVTLSDELRHLDLYLQIEKVRFGHRLGTEIICDEIIQELKLPPMILQPVVENAIKFGLYDTIGDILIRIRAGKTDTDLVITISNPFDPASSGTKGTGFGLSSLQRRLYLLFARNDLVSTEAIDTLYYTTIKIPQNDPRYTNR